MAPFHSNPNRHHNHHIPVKPKYPLEARHPPPLPPMKKSMHEQGYVLSSLCFLIPLCTPSGIMAVHDCCFCISDCLSCIGVGFVKEAVDFLLSCSVSYFSIFFIFLKISCFAFRSFFNLSATLTPVKCFYICLHIGSHWVNFNESWNKARPNYLTLKTTLFFNAIFKKSKPLRKKNSYCVHVFR